MKIEELAGGTFREGVHVKYMDLRESKGKPRWEKVWMWLGHNYNIGSTVHSSNKITCSYRER